LREVNNIVMEQHQTPDMPSDTNDTPSNANDAHKTPPAASAKIVTPINVVLFVIVVGLGVVIISYMCFVGLLFASPTLREKILPPTATPATLPTPTAAPASGMPTDLCERWEGEGDVVSPSSAEGTGAEGTRYGLERFLAPVEHRQIAKVACIAQAHQIGHIMVILNRRNTAIGEPNTVNIVHRHAKHIGNQNLDYHIVRAD
jgi:hypothetical protein